MRNTFQTTLIPAILCLILVTGCRSAYYAAYEKFGVYERDLLKKDVTKARDEQAGAQQQFKDAMSRLCSLPRTACSPASTACPPPKWMLVTERISREIAHVPAFNESISTVDDKPHGHVLYSWNSGYWWLRGEIRKRLGQAGPDPVEAAIDERLGVVRPGGMLRLEPEAPATVAGEPSKEVAFHRNLAAAEPLPFSFIYGGRPAGEWIGRWQRTVKEKAIDATKVQRIITLNDPDTGLQVRAVLAIYTDTPGVDWTLYFANQGTNDTPLLEQVNAAVRAACRPRCVQNCA